MSYLEIGEEQDGKTWRRPGICGGLLIGTWRLQITLSSGPSMWLKHGWCQGTSLMGNWTKIKICGDMWALEKSCGTKGDLGCGTKQSTEWHASTPSPRPVDNVDGTGLETQDDAEGGPKCPMDNVDEQQVAWFADWHCWVATWPGNALHEETLKTKQGSRQQNPCQDGPTHRHRSVHQGVDNRKIPDKRQGLYAQ